MYTYEYVIFSNTAAAAAAAAAQQQQQRSPLAFLCNGVQLCPLVVQRWCCCLVSFGFVIYVGLVDAVRFSKSLSGNRFQPARNGSLYFREFCEKANKILPALVDVVRFRK